MKLGFDGIKRIVEKFETAQKKRLEQKVIELGKRNLELKQRVTELTAEVKLVAPTIKARQEMLRSADECLLFEETEEPEGRTEELAMLLTKLSPRVAIFTPIAYQKIECWGVTEKDSHKIVSLGTIDQEQAEKKLADYIEEVSEALSQARGFLYESKLQKRKTEEEIKRKREAKIYAYQNLPTKYEMRRIEMSSERTPKEYLQFFLYSSVHYGCGTPGDWCGFCYKAFKKADSEYPLGELREAIGRYDSTRSYIQRLAIQYSEAEIEEEEIEHIVRRETPARVLHILAGCKKEILSGKGSREWKEKQIKYYEKLAYKARTMKGSSGV